jgi:hypothetical protein
MEIKVYLSLIFLLYILLFHGANLMVKGLELRSQELYSLGFMFLVTGFVLSLVSFFMVLVILVTHRES